MTIDTNDLIDRLANDLAPVEPLPRPAQRAGAWLLGSVLYLALLTFVLSRVASATDGPDIGLLWPQLIGVVAGILAAVAAFASVVPGYSRRVLVWPAVATLGWLAVLVFSALGSSDEQNVLAASQEWVCVAVILLGGTPLVVALTVMLRRGAPLNPALTALLGALAVGLLANFGACLSRPHPEDAVTLAWHGGALIALAVACIAGAHFVLNWASRKNA
jgi:hypothetical protein